MSDYDNVCNVMYVAKVSFPAALNLIPWHLMKVSTSSMELFNSLYGCFGIYKTQLNFDDDCADDFASI